MDELEALRKQIDDIDREMVKLFEKRMETVFKIGEYKSKRNIPILNRSREKEVISKSIGYLKDESLKNYLEEFFKNLMSISKKLQKRM